MVSSVVRVLCVISLLGSPAFCQSARIDPLRFAAGTLLRFHTQTRINADSGNETDLLPSGTILEVKLLDSIDSGSAQDGAEFSGTVISPVVLGNKTILHSGSKVQVLLVLLRSKTHPDGFRYELLVTGVTDQGKSYYLTASLNPSFADISTPPPTSGEMKTESDSGEKTTGKSGN
jgi:hypothetical protein